MIDKSEVGALHCKCSSWLITCLNAKELKINAVRQHTDTEKEFEKFWYTYTVFK